MIDYQVHKDELVAQVSGMLAKAKGQGRALTPDERARAKELLDAAQEAADSAVIVDQIDSMGKAGAAPEGRFGLGDAVRQAGFNVKSMPSVSVPPTWLLKASPTIPAITDLSRSAPVVVPLGFDRRWLYPNLVRQDVGDALSIQDFTQTVRTPSGTLERSPTATTAKATLATTTTLVNEAVKQLAIIADGIPLALLESVDGMRAYFEGELRFQVEKALDAHVFAQVVAAAPPFGTTGTGLPAQVRNGIATMRAEGADPDLLILNATDAAALDLFADTAGHLVFSVRDTGTSNPLWGLKVIERTSATGLEPPYLLDSRMLGVLYLGPARLDADPYSGVGAANFSKNLVDLRIEQLALFHVRNAKGARRIAAT